MIRERKDENARISCKMCRFGGRKLRFVFALVNIPIAPYILFNSGRWLPKPTSTEIATGRAPVFLCLKGEPCLI